MSRVHYQNDTIQKAMQELDDLEQSIGWNLRCAYPGCCSREDSMKALAQTLEHFSTVRGLLDEVQAEVLKCFVDAPAERTEEAKQKRRCLLRALPNLPQK
jgi:hypothetical protein